MHTDENNAIRYLMKEMDPSEEMEFEKLMREDENILIEVESLRATTRKLSALPIQNPPKQLTQKITNDAKQLQSQKKSKNNSVSFFLKRGVAAVILLSAFTGGFYYYSGTTGPLTSVNTSSVNVEPWVDRNEIIRFSDTEQVKQVSAIEPDLAKSYEKLQLVSDLSSNSFGNNGILLTGSSE